jgi:hypothetical protein
MYVGVKKAPDVFLTERAALAVLNALPYVCHPETKSL